MKPLLLSIILLFSYIANCQLPNASFELWDTIYKEIVPYQWSNYGNMDLIKRTTDANSGQYAMLLQSRSYHLTVSGGDGDIDETIRAISYTITDDEEGINISQRIDTLKGFYKYHIAIEDTGSVMIMMFDSTSEIIGYGMGTITGDQPSYIPFSIPVEWYSSDTPELAIIQISPDHIRSIIS